MKMSPNKGEAAVHGYLVPGDMPVRMREVLAWPWAGARVTCSHYVYLPKQPPRTFVVVVTFISISAS